MPIPIDTPTLQELIASGAQLVEVLPHKEYDQEHLPGAINLPLTDLTAEKAVATLDRGLPVVAYCFDYQ